ncbi:MAG: hypothetical protein Q9220_000044 [cf. Caloplaca sp. 1 TL-2023]
MADFTPTSIRDNLARLAAKPGVQSTLVLSRSNGSILSCTGLLATRTTSDSSDASLAGENDKRDTAQPAALDHDSGNGVGRYDEEEGPHKSADHLAQKVFTFMAAAQEFAEGVEKGDETKLLRIRTKKQEIVIVPG